LRSVGVAFFALKEQSVFPFLMCVCNLSYPARKALSSYYIVTCALCGCIIFSHIIS